MYRNISSYSYTNFRYSYHNASFSNHKNKIKQNLNRKELLLNVKQHFFMKVFFKKMEILMLPNTLKSNSLFI